MLPDCHQGFSPLSLFAFFCRIGRLPLLRGKLVCFQQRLHHVVCVCLSVCASMRVCVRVCQRVGAYQLAGCNPYYIIYCLIRCSCFVVSFCDFVLAAQSWFRVAPSSVRILLGSGPPRSRLGSSYVCRITRQRGIP